jgi:hypothetical protein
MQSLVYHKGMNKLNLLFTLYSLTAFVIIVERLLPATRLLLPPHNFIRLHEINQTVIFLSITIAINVLQLKMLTNDFQLLKVKNSTFLLVLFIVGVYLYGAGEGWHEVASFTFNTYCNTRTVTGNLCNGLFINDYYAGNIIFFIGAILIPTVLMAFSLKQPMKMWNNKELTIMFINSLVFAFTWFAYAAFDIVFIGLIALNILMIISLFFFSKIRTTWKQYPFLAYNAAAYTLATVATLIVKFH